MSTEPRSYCALFILFMGLVLSACVGAETTPQEQATSPPTNIPPTARSTQTRTPPTSTNPPPTSTLPPATLTQPPPTATPTEEPRDLYPSSRGYVSMAYDSESKQVIMFGGITGNEHEIENYSSETWAFDVVAQSWTEKSPPESPGPRSTFGGMVYDAESDRVILFGGIRTRERTIRETWAYDFNTNTWTKMDARPPTKRFGQAIAYDAESDRVILFSGFDFDSYKMIQDTWAYDYNTDTWTEMKPEISPPGQAFHALTYDPTTDRVILWGGDTWTPDPTNITPRDSSVWAYDYNTNTWEQYLPDIGPSPRTNHAMAFDENAKKVLMYGGTDSGTTEVQAYDYNTNSWETIPGSSPFPGALSRHAMVYVPDIDRFVVFGGQLGSRLANYINDTWIYDLNTNTWTNLTPES